MNIKKITIIGGGNLGTAIAKGLLKLNGFNHDTITITEKRSLRIKQLQDEGFNVIANDNTKAIKGADLIIISVKPQQMPDILKELTSVIDSNKQIIVSSVTGFGFAEIIKHTGNSPLARIMPNTAIEIKASMTCISFINTNPEQEAAIVGLFKQLGVALVVQEELLHAATVLGACGIAFALRFIRAATQGGIEIGFSSELSQLIVTQTVKGAASLILENNTHPETEIDKVTTPQGITISGLNEMEHQGFSSALIKGLMASFNKLEKNNKNN